MPIKMVTSVATLSVLAILFSPVARIGAAEKREKALFKRIRASTEEDLRKQLLSIPDVGLDQPSAAVMYAPLQPASSSRLRPTRLPSATASALPFDYGPRFLLQLADRQSRLSTSRFLPWISNPDCQLGKETAERLDVLSVNLRAALQASASVADKRPDPEKLKGELLDARKPGRQAF